MTQACEQPRALAASSPGPAPRRVLPLLAVGTALVLWASAFVVIRHVGDDVSPGGLALGRALVGSLTLGVVLALRRRTWRRPSRGDLTKIVVIGILWFGVHNIALSAGERRIDAGTAAMLFQVAPLLIALMATMFLGERSSSRTWAGLLVAFGGVSIISLAGPGGDRDVVGVALCLLAAVASSVGVILQKPLGSRLSALQITWLACLAGAVMCMPFAGDLSRGLASATVGAIGWIVYLGVFPTAVAYSLYAYALSGMSVSNFAATAYLLPPLTVAMAWVVLAESPGPAALLGGVLCLAGVVVSRPGHPAGQLLPAPPADPHPIPPRPDALSTKGRTRP